MFFVITYNNKDTLVNLQTGLIMRRCEIGRDDEAQLGLAITLDQQRWQIPANPATIQRFENLVSKIKKEYE